MVIQCLRAGTEPGLQAVWHLSSLVYFAVARSSHWFCVQSNTKQERWFFSMITDPNADLSPDFRSKSRFLLDNPYFPMLSHLVPLTGGYALRRMRSAGTFAQGVAGTLGKRQWRRFLRPLSIR